MYIKRILVIPVNSELNLEITNTFESEYIKVKDSEYPIKLVINPESAKLDFN